MSHDIWKVLQAMAGAAGQEDAQLKAAAEKIAHQPEMGATSGNSKQTEGVIDEQVGKTTMDAKAILHTKAQEQAGKELEGVTWDDPREAANARNLGVSAGQTPKAPLDTNRHNTQAVNKNLPRPVHTTPNKPKIATQKKASGLVDAGGKALSSGGGRFGGIAKHKKSIAIGAGGAAAGFAGGRASKKASEYSLADYYADLCAGEDAMKTASENVPTARYLGVVKQASYGQLMGFDIGLGMLDEAAGIPADA